MCGIICGCSFKNVIPGLLQGLQRLEYRGYDSAGLACMNNQQLTTTKRVGKVKTLVQACQKQNSKIAIAHTRWATHGKPTEHNAHPHQYQTRLAWVHNGIIHNHATLRKKLTKLGYEFSSNTDSEVIGYLLHHHLQETNDMLIALQQTCAELKGSYALVVLDQEEPENLYFSCYKSPLVIGIGNQEMFIASDPLSLVNQAQSFIYLQNNQAGVCSISHYKIINLQTLEQIEPCIQKLDVSYDSARHSQHKHHMHKEIYEQPEITQRCLDYYLDHNQPSEQLQAILQTIANLQEIQAIQLLGCGSSHFASLIGAHWIEAHQAIQVNCDISSEYREKNHHLIAPTLLLTLSQSGETADTLYALEHAKQFGYQATGTLCNVSHSSLVRDSELFFPLLAGPEVGVASTKAVTTQLLLLFLISLYVHPTQKDQSDLLTALFNLPELINQTLNLESDIEQLAWQISKEQQMLFLGRGICYPTALEGALKLKELSYIHAHAYPAGELKHGPLALVDHQLITIGLLPNDHLRAKTLASFREIQARNGKLVVFYQGEKQDLEHIQPTLAIQLPNTHPTQSPFVFTVALQLLAYHIALHLGHDVDQPRNLAKSVTVE